MRKYYLTKLFIVAFAAVAIQGCSPKDLGSISVLQTPYALYFCDSSGQIMHTNDGLKFYTDFHPDGIPAKAIVISGPNVMMVKVAAHIGVGNGKTLDFNPTYLYPNPNAFGPSSVLNSSSGRVYMASYTSGSGIVYSDQHCAINSWQGDMNFPSTDTATPPNLGNQMTSFAQLQNSTIFAYDWVHQSLYTTPGGGSPWTRVSYASGSSDTIPTSTSGPFHLFHINNDLVALDYFGINGGWHSGDNGQTWHQYSGLPLRPLLCGAAAFEEVFLVGTDSAGVFMLQANGTFQESNKGIDRGTSVRGIIAKQNLYEGGTSQQYVYIATSTGIYRSFDLGFNWTKILAGNYYTIQ